MKVLCILITHNAGQILPFTFRHYDQFVDEYWICDDRSTDQTIALCDANPRAKNIGYSGMTGLIEDQNLSIIYKTYPRAVERGFDWVITPDPDEFLYAQPGTLNKILYSPYEVIRTCGFNLTGPQFPVDDGRQIYEINPMGVRAPIYSKPILFRPRIHIEWVRGKHNLENCKPNVSPRPFLKLLHARYFGAEHTRQRNAYNYGRLVGDKAAGWSCKADYDGADAQHEGSPSWADWARQFEINVLETPLYD